MRNVKRNSGVGTVNKGPNENRNDKEYWKCKVCCFFHDPPTKVFDIDKHKENAKELVENKLGIGCNKRKGKEVCELCKEADKLVTSVDRFISPHLTMSRQTAVKYDNKVLYHPLSSCRFEAGRIEGKESEYRKRFVNELKERLEGIEDDFFWVFHCIRHFIPRLLSLREKSLSWFWEHLPADSRIPDHGIWHHCAMTSAIHSCFQKSQKKNIDDEIVSHIYLFEFIPVQGFISGARKLRDFWTGSMLVSYLTFSVMVRVIEELGSDHIVFPNPIGQPLVDRYLYEKLKKKLHPESRLLKEIEQDILRDGFNGSDIRRMASLPNRIFLLIPDPHRSDGHLETFRNSFVEAWEEIWRGILGYTESKLQQLLTSKFRIGNCSRCLEPLRSIFKRQCNGYWKRFEVEFPLLTKTKSEKSKKSKSVSASDFSDNPFFKKALENLNRISERYNEILMNFRNKPELYSACYGNLIWRLDFLKSTSLDWSAVDEDAEEGIKCRLHPELEALKLDCHGCREKCELKRTFAGSFRPDNPAFPYRAFWKLMEDTFRGEFKSGEMLSAVGLIKRLLWRWLRETDRQKLSETLRVFADHVGIEDCENISFDSTYEVALREPLKKIEENYGREEVNKLIRAISDGDIESVFKKKKIKLETPDKYYAIVFMDGDGIGEILSKKLGKKVWEFLHPDFKEKLYKKCPKCIEAYKEMERDLSLSIHGHVSKCMTDFSRVALHLVTKHDGVLVYTGGDDLCALFPARRVAEAVRELFEFFNSDFIVRTKMKDRTYVRRKDTGSVSEIERYFLKNLGSGEDVVRIDESKEVLQELYYGFGKDVTVSAGVYISHCKWPMRGAIERAKHLLRSAKHVGKVTGRGGWVAFELQRRNGEARGFIARIDGKEFTNFCKVLNSKEFPGTLPYKIEKLSGIFTEEKILRNFIASKLKLPCDDELVESLSSILKMPNLRETLEGMTMGHGASPNATERNGGVNADAIIIASFLAKTMTGGTDGTSS